MYLQDMLEKFRWAFGASTLNNNLFKKAVESVEWEQVFAADGETYYVLGDITFTTPSLIPAQCKWQPSFLVDGGIIELDGKCIDCR